MSADSVYLVLPNKNRVEDILPFMASAIAAVEGARITSRAVYKDGSIQGIEITCLHHGRQEVIEVPTRLNPITLVHFLGSIFRRLSENRFRFKYLGVGNGREFRIWNILAVSLDWPEFDEDQFDRAAPSSEEVSRG